jgi:hypothetical protein
MPTNRKEQGIMSLNERFRKFSVWTANALGSPWLFVANIFLILLWLACGPLFHFSDAWQLVVNTATSVITYLAVFLTDVPLAFSKCLICLSHVSGYKAILVATDIIKSTGY